MLATAAVLAGSAFVATPAAAADLIPVPKTDYQLFGVSSESPAYPAPPALDGTALGAWDGVFTTQWASNYAKNAPAPHWIVIDQQRPISVKAIDYYMRKSQSKLYAQDVAIYVTNDAATAALAPTADNLDAWGAPAAVTKLSVPTSDTAAQRITLPTAVTGRYVMVQVRTTSGVGVAAGEIEILSDQAIPPITVDPGTGEIETQRIAKGEVAANVAVDFPQIVDYDVAGTTFGGNHTANTSWVVNGTTYPATTTSTFTESSVDYVSVLEGLDVTIKSTVSVTDDATVQFEVTEISGADTVNTLAIPGNSFLSTTSDEAGSQLSRTVVDPNSTRNADVHVPITATTAKVNQNASYAFLTNGVLAASMMTNATTQASGSTPSWNTRLATSVTGTDKRTAAIGSAGWLVHPTGATDDRVSLYELPKVTVLFAGDRNGDTAIDWQDAAIRYREVDVDRLGADRVAERVVSRIPFNFASSATNPFDLTLANTQRIANQTDGLGQWVLNKGYGNEGHDSANTDYGGNYNERAGGLADFNALVEAGKSLNADMSVHVNATEIYPQANAFDPAFLETTTDPTKAPYAPGWNWLDQSYYLNQQAELGTGQVVDRFQQLRDEVPGLSGVYIDVYYSNGWVAEGLANELRDMDLEIATEWGDKFVDSSVWAHWPNDLAYGGIENKGINSTMVRFMQNAEADVWNDDALLGGQRLVDAEGWVGNANWDGFITNIWDRSLPTKFLQHFELQTYKTGDVATFTDNVQSKIVDGKRTISVDGATVLTGDSYLLPWQSVATTDEVGSPLNADKMYFYSKAGGSQTFDLTHAFDGVTSFSLYKLTDQGRASAGSVTAVDGTLTITGEAGVAYLVVPDSAPTKAPVAYESGPVRDMGFNSGNLDAWSPLGDVTLTRTKAGTGQKASVGDNVVSFGAAASSISQKISGLTPGQRYSFSVQLEIGQSENRAVTVSAEGDVRDTHVVSMSPLLNTVAADSKGGTNFQRAAVSTVANAAGEVTIGVSADAGAASVRVDNARIMIDTTAATADGTILSEDFEGNQPGWGPFVKGSAGGETDPRTSISHRQEPYTSIAFKETAYPYQPGGPLAGTAIDSVISGERSLLTHLENTGLVYRTTPTTVDFEAGHAYRVSFNYQSSHEGGYEWIVGSDRRTDGKFSAETLKRIPFGAVRETTEFSLDFTAGCGDSTFIGLNRLGGVSAEFTLDDLKVVDLGEVTDLGCANITASSGQLTAGVASPFTTTFTNSENVDATNIAQQLTLPDGWSAQVQDGSSNLAASLAPGESYSTKWLITPSEDAAGTSAPITVTGTYLADCIVRNVEATVNASVSTRAIIPSSTITATASSEETAAGASEGPARLMLDGDPSTIWHSKYSTSATSYPHTLTFDLGVESTVDGIGYLRRTSNQNGPIKGYTVETSVDGVTYTQVAAGEWQNIATMQDVNFTAVQARYIKVTALSSISGTQFAAVAEMAFYGRGAALTGHAAEPRPEDDLTGCEAGPVTLDVSSSSVEAGSTVDATIGGLASGTAVTLLLDDVEVASATVGADGSVVVPVVIPGDTTPGAHTLTVRDETGDRASVALTVTERQLNVTTSVVPRCVAGKVVLTLVVTNREAGPIAVTATYGTTTKSFPTVAPSKAVSAVFSTGSSSIDAGSVTVKATAGGSAATTIAAPYPATACK